MTEVNYRELLASITVLYVEADDTTRNETAAMLEPYLKTLYPAADADEAIAAYRAHTPDIVVTGIQLPKMTGLEMTKKIRRIHPDTPVIITSIFNDPGLFLEAINIGIDGYITKPVDEEKLLDTLCKNALLVQRKQKETSRLEFIRLILDASPSFMLTMRDGRVEFINKTFLHFMGHDSLDAFTRSGDTLIGHFEKIEEESDELFDTNMWLQYIIDNPGRQHIAYLKKGDRDAPAPYIIQYTELAEIERYLFTFSDISQVERRKDHFEQIALDAKKEIAFKQKLLEMQSRQAQMGEMIGAIAHQWKQPLNALGLVLQDLEDAYVYGEITESYMKESVATGMRNIAYMSQTIDDFKNFFKPNKSRKKFNVAKAIREVLELLGKQYQNNGIAITIVEREKVKILGHVNEFKQVIINLLNNARDAFLDNAVKQRRVTITVWRENNAACITVRDNAGGVQESIMEQMFEAYVTTKSEEKGTGIGLYMSRIIIQSSLGGEITVRNTGEAEKRGAEFLLRIPLED